MKKAEMLRLVLIGEDDNRLKQIRQILFNSGLKMTETTVDSLQEFKSAVTEPDPDVIILDGISESISPADISRFLKESYLHIPVLLIIPDDEEEQAINYIKDDVIDDYVLASHKKRLSVSVTMASQKKFSNKSQEQSLRWMVESEKRWKAVFNSEPECIIVIRPEGDISEINPSGLICLEADELKKVINKSIWPFIHPEDLKAYKKFHQTVARGNSASIQFRLKGLNKNISWMSANGSPLRDTQQHIISVLLIARNITESVQLQKELEHKEEKYRTLSTHVPVGIIQTDLYGDCTYVNPFWCRLAGITSEQAMYKGWIDAIHPEDRNNVFNEWNNCTKNNNTFHEEFRFLTAKGEINWVSASAIALKDNKNEIAGFLGTITDINDTKHFEEALIESQSRLEAAQELAKVGDWDLDLQTQTGSWSKEMYPIHGTDSTLGPPSFPEFLNLIHPEDREKVISFRQKVIENGHYIGEDYRILLQDGNIRHVYPTAYCMYDGEGRATRLIGTLIDVTERVKSHESIKRNEQLIDTLFLQSIDGMFISKSDLPFEWNYKVDKEALLEYAFKNFRVVKVNDAFLEMHGSNRKQIIGITPALFYSAKEIEVNKQIWRDLFDNGQTRYETLTCKFDGSPLWIQADYICIYDSQARITGYLGFQKDITKEKTALEELKFSERNFREIFENSPDGIYIEDYNGLILNVNPEACRIQRLSRENLIGKNILDITPESKKDIINADFNKFCQGTIDRVESFSWDKDWNPIPVEIKVNRIIYSGIPAILLHVRDMSIKKFTNGFFTNEIKNALDSADAGTWDWNVVTGEYKSSGIYDHMLGYRKGELHSTFSGWLQLIHPGDISLYKSRLSEHLEGQSDYCEVEFRIRTKQGEYKWILCRGRTVEKDPDHVPVRVTGIIVAISGHVMMNISNQNDDRTK